MKDNGGWFVITRYDAKTGQYRPIKVYIPTKDEDE